LKIKKHEIRASESVGGKRHVGSGALFFAKGDGSGKNYTIECKRTDLKSISIKASYLDKITKEAAMQGKLPLLFLNISTVGVLTEKDWVLMELSKFKELTDCGNK
jgi:hypothetical protein